VLRIYYLYLTLYLSLRKYKFYKRQKNVRVEGRGISGIISTQIQSQIVTTNNNRQKIILMTEKERLMQACAELEAQNELLRQEIPRMEKELEKLRKEIDLRRKAKGD
jgi:dynactin complex subunit